MRILNAMTEYLGDKLEMTPGENIFYNEMPSEPTKCVAIAALVANEVIPAQVDAAVHNLRITARDQRESDAYHLAIDCYRWCRVDGREEDNPTGFIELPTGDVIFIQLYGEPIWEKTDQLGRRYYTFVLQAITKRKV